MCSSDLLPNSAEKHIVYVQKTGYGDERLVLHPPFPERITIDLKAIERGGFRGKRGALTINLQWYTIDDLDLHVIDPEKNEIYHANDTVQYETGVAHLDVDANQSDNDLLDDPQENIYWDSPPAGQYTIVVHNYRSRTHSPVPFRIIILKDSEKIELEGIVTEEKEQWQYILTL